MFLLTNTSKCYGSTVALDVADLRLPPGRVSALIGPSGAGKSTILRLLIGLEWPDSGTVHFNSEPLRREQLLAHRRRIGYVIQEGGLFPHLSALGNIGLLARTLGWSATRIEHRARELAELCQLPFAALVRYPAELSGGQRQRVGLIRALMLDPAVLLLDEPLGALDPLIRFDLQTELKGLFDSLGKTVILVTHDIAEAAFLADELVLLNRGRVVQQGPLSVLLDTPSEPFVRRFLTAQRSLQAPS